MKQPMHWKGYVRTADLCDHGRTEEIARLERGVRAERYRQHRQAGRRALTLPLPGLII